MKLLLNLVFSAMFILSYTELKAQWNSNTLMNTPVCTSTGKQIDLRMMKDDDGGVFVTWKDYRPSTGIPDIYIQRFDSNGYALWPSNGVVLCDDPADQSTPAIVTDMRGGAIVAWSDWRSSIERDLYAQRVDGNGNIKWMVNGMNVTNLSNREHSEKIVSDGYGGVIIVFEKQNGLWDIWAQRLDSSGNKMWGAGGVAVTNISGNRRNHKVQKDRNGGAIITWQDLRNGSNYDIYAQRVDANGNLKWGASAKPVCVAAGDQINPKIESDSATNGAYIAWQDSRSTTTDDIYMQRLDSNGNATWITDGIVISNQIGTQSALDMMSVSGGSNVIITWKDNRNGNYDIYAQKVSNDGLFQWNPTGVVLCNSIYDQINPNICSDENKGAIIVWQDSSAGNWDVKTQRINSNGFVQWTTNGEIVCNAINDQTSPKNTSDGKGGSIYAWQDKRTGESDIYIHHINKNWAVNTLDIAENASLHLYPNPARENVTISFNSMKNIRNVFAVSLLGQHIQLPFHSITNQEIIVDIQSLPIGIYTLEIQLPTAKLHTKLAKD